MHKRQLHRRAARLRGLIEREDQFDRLTTFGAVDGRLLAGADRGDAAEGAAALASVRPAAKVPVDEWALWREAAVTLQAAGKGDAALEWWRRLLALPALGANLRLQWLPEAIRAARDAGSMSDAEGWQAELLRLPPAAASGR